MKGVILAGGTGSRLYPLTKATNKHLLPVGNMPMIYWPLYTLRDGGINDILIVTGGEHFNHVKKLGNGKEFGVNLNYEEQREPGGIAQALGISKEFVGRDSVAVILGDNIFQDIFKFDDFNYGSRIYLKQVNDPERFGVAELEENKVVGIAEKPRNPKSNFAVTGLYVYDNEVYDVIDGLRPSGRGELEITDVNNYFVRGNNTEAIFVNGFWSDAGTFPSLKRSNLFAYSMQDEKD
jgi:glucose-1-phosphate thymidylyltransferase